MIEKAPIGSLFFAHKRAIFAFSISQRQEFVDELIFNNIKYD